MTAAKWGETPRYEQFFARELPEVRKAFGLLVDFVREGRVDEKHETDLENALPAAQLLAVTAEEETAAAALIDIGLRGRASGDLPRLERALSDKTVTILTDGSVYGVASAGDLFAASPARRQIFAALASIMMDTGREALTGMLQEAAFMDVKVLAEAGTRMKRVEGMARTLVEPVADRLESPGLTRVFRDALNGLSHAVAAMPKVKPRGPGLS